MTDVLILYEPHPSKNYRVRPLTEQGKQWLRGHSPAEFWHNDTLIVPEKVIERLTMALHAEGLILGGES